ncbi:hypothetical protein GIB67_038613 [Kingdonia uniflora]|uniref:Uncharacterized protein n=1 Tax=Kingdonia uniflora TaxID=39325 RepID=A0A7J7NPL8_9MAGN|nr:hypothetical protein GIB67_038613 [Kingdonia uniflora]
MKTRHIKTTQKSSKSHHQTPSIPMLKGKEKINEDETLTLETTNPDSSSSTVCGICFSEDGKAIRGCIDSCNHYFCFVCIMEWSKIESRCPMCKQRFNTILRPSKTTGCFIRERIVNVPLRNQVWHPLGNVTTGPSDPYAQVNCTECHGLGDENLLLLCDLCDSGAHTYCVGLGNTVPEGDWYCHDCTVSRNDHSDSQIGNEYCNQDSRNFESKGPGEASVSISEIVRGSYLREVGRSLPERASSCANHFSSPNVPDRSTTARPRATDLSARTLRRCRNVQSHIKILRENWNSLRSGSLRFSSSLPVLDTKESRKYSSVALTSDMSSRPPLPFSTSCPQMTTKDIVSCDKKSSRDISRAWKMMDKAKSLKRPREVTRTVSRMSSHGTDKRSVPKGASCTNSCNPISKHKPIPTSKLGGIASENSHKYNDSERERESYKCLTSNAKKLSRAVPKETLSVFEKFPGTHTSEYFVVPSDNQAHRYIHADPHHDNEGKLSMQISKGASSRLITERNGTASSVSFTQSSPVASVIFVNRLESGASFCFKAEQPNENDGIEISSAKVITRKDDGSKAEVQSLVKLNLKLLTRGKQLGVNEFKEVARLSTHTILAACGLDHKKSSVCPFPNSICRHTDQSQQIRMSNLMPTSCRGCFYVFVKEVVNSIMVERITHDK